MVARKVTLQRRTSTITPEGQASQSWETIYSTRGVVRQLSGSETITQRREISANTIRVTIPFSSKALDLTTDNAVLISGLRYNIDVIDTDTKWRESVTLNVVEFNER